MRLSLKVLLLAILAAVVYFAYKEVFSPFVETGKGRVKTFYGTVPDYSP